MPTFTEPVHGLPPELFDRIRDYVFTLAKGEILIRSKYLPLKLLQINRAAREQYAEDFYGPGTVLQFEDCGTLLTYLQHLTEPHRQLIRAVQLMVNVPRKTVDPYIAGTFLCVKHRLLAGDQQRDLLRK